MSWLSTTLHDAAPLASRRACLGGLPRSHPVARDAARFFDRRGAPADDHILHRCPAREHPPHLGPRGGPPLRDRADRKSTRLNSSHVAISYAVFCLKKKIGGAG